MGYESRLVIVRKSKLNADNKVVWAEHIADVNLCVVGNCVAKFRAYPPTNCYFYDRGVDEPIVEDMYGDKLNEIPLADAIQILEDAEKEEHYRRYVIAIGLLKSFTYDDWCDDIVVLHYGY